MELNLWFEPALRVVDPCERPPEGDAKQSIVLHMARNGYESCQLLIRADEPVLIESISFPCPPEGVQLRGQFVERIQFDSGTYSDPLSGEPGCAIPANFTQSLWITAFAAPDAHTGEAHCRVVLETDAGCIERAFTLMLHQAVLPDNSDAAFSMEYWMNTANFWFRYPEKNQLDFIKDRYGVEKYSDEWWALNEAIAQNLREHRVNVLFVRTHDLLLDGGTTLSGDGQYNFRWELFDRFIDLYIEHAHLRWLAGYHLVVQTVGEDAYVLRRAASGEMEIAISPLPGGEAENYLDQLLPALRAHLMERGWLGRWLQHIQDEPHSSNTWCTARALVRRYMPEVLCLDAIDNQKPMAELQGEMDLWIPRVDIYEQHRAFYDHRLNLGDKRWTYTCCVPNEMNYVNKFIDWPLLHNRVLFWGCFTRGFTGFLHWGYNFWDPNCEWFGLNERAYFKGDGYVVYPDRAHLSVKSSIRQAATRDSAQDYELLIQLAARDPQAAYALSERVIRRFNDFNWDFDTFTSARLELLMQLDA